MLFLMLVLSKASGEIICNGLYLQDTYNIREILLTNFGRPNNLVMHKFTNTIFFSHTLKSLDFQIISHDFNNNQTKIIDVPGGYAIAYDSGNDDIYFGGHDGIYKYNFLTHKADFFAEDGKSIWGLFVGSHFYYIAYPSQKLYVYQDDIFFQVSEAVDIEMDNFFISKRQDIYYSNETAVYKVDKASGTTNMLSDEIIVRQIAEDVYGDIYFCGGDGIYVEDKVFSTVKKIADIDVFGLTFDENDLIIYSNKDTIYRLTPSYESPCNDMRKNTPTIDN